MNASMLFLTTAWMAGADVTPAPVAAPVAAPAVMVTPVGHCSSCGSAPAPAAAPVASCDTCGADPCGPTQKASFLSKLKGKFGHKKSGDCDSCDAPASPPVFAGFTTACSDPCASGSKPGLFAKLKARFAKGDSCCTPAPSCDSCGSAPVAGAPVMSAPPAPGCALPPIPGAVVPAPTPEAPKVMPKPIETPKPIEAPKPKATEEPKPKPKPIEPKTTQLEVPPIVTPVSSGLPTIPVVTPTGKPF